jgi:hypothetical protein
VSAASPNLVVDAPALGASASSPLRVSGRGRNLYEANVIVEVRVEFAGAGLPLAVVPTTAAGSGPDLAPFSVDVPFDASGATRGAVVVRSDSGLEGTPEATVVPVDFPAPDPGATTEIQVFLQDAQQDFVPVTRSVPRTQAVLRAALEQLLTGATPEEEARGLSSPFSDDADLLRSVTITGNGTAVVDLDPSFGTAVADSPNAAVLGSLDHTVFQFPSVVWVSYRFGGECGTFGEIDPSLLCDPRTRDEY